MGGSGNSNSNSANNGSRNSFKKYGSVFHAKERRRAQRLLMERVPLIIQYSDVIDEEADTIHALMTDISVDGTGLALITSRRIESGTRLNVQIQDPKFSAIFQAETAWCNELPVTGHVLKPEEKDFRWRLGLKLIVDPNNEEHQKLLKKLQDLA